MHKSSYMVLGAVLGVGTMLAASHLQIFGSALGRGATADTYRQLNLFGDVFERVRSDYVDQPKDEQLVETALNGMLSALDPHSGYLSARSFRDMQVQTRGEFGGLGIEVTMENGLVKVVAPIDETPAARAGVRPGDLITHLDGDQVLGLNLQQAVEKMRGPVGSAISLKVQRPGVDDLVEIKIVRDVIKIVSVRQRQEGGDVGYIRITQFNEQTDVGVRNAIEQISSNLGNNLKGYILDLRNNPGGLLDQSIKVSATFIERGEIVSTRGRRPEDTRREYARTGDLTKGKPLIVLMNGGSASASEIVAGALQDHKRATILGTRSFGKGSVQTIIPLGQQNGAIRLTTARYFTPSGRSIQAQGIDPDILLQPDLPEAERARSETKGEAALRGHLKAEGEEKSASSSYVAINALEDNQLQMALSLIRGQAKNAAFPPPAVPGKQGSVR